MLIVAAVIYGSIYSREESIATGIGANLVPAERVLKGEVPYRDFYKIQTPGILLLNAGLFKFLGTSLITSLKGVLVFKVLAVCMVFIVARLVAPSMAALVSTLLTLVWLPPGGPFRPAPIQYEMPFVLAATYFTLRWLDSRKAVSIFAAGIAVGFVAVFKQNVGVYAAIALGLSVIFNTRALPLSLAEAKRLYLDSWKESARAHIAAAAGVGLPLVALLVYLIGNHALGAALRVFVRGPGEHIQMKLTGYPLPKHAALIAVSGALALIASAYLARRWPKLKTAITGCLLAGATLSALIVPQEAIDNSIFWFAPSLFMFALFVYFRASRNDESLYAPGNRARGVLLILLLFAAASYGEVFPRSVRGLLIGTMPPAFILLAFLLGRRRSTYRASDPAGAKHAGVFAPPHLNVVFVTLGLVLAVFALRTILPHYFYFDSSRMLRLRANTELGFDRGRGVYLPDKRAGETDSTVEFIRSRVEDGGYFFAHALDATSYYFLSDRNSPTGATLWNDAGTNDAERARTIEALRAKQVRLVLTSEEALSRERYEPLLEYLKNDFHQGAVIGKTVFLERNY